MKKEMIASNCLNMQYTLLKGMFFDYKKETENYILCTSKIMDDYFWNIAYLKYKIDKEILMKIKSME